MISEVLSEAFRVYGRLWRMSVVVAGLVFAVVSLAAAFAGPHPTAAEELVSILLSLVGGLLVQGALVLVVRDLHEGRAPASVNTYYGETRSSLGTLLGTSIVYGLGAFLMVPIARWALAVPLVMIDGLGRREAFARSAELVRGRWGRVLLLVILANVITGLIGVAVRTAFGFLPEFWSVWVGGTIASAMAVPYEAHVLTVLYYKLTAPEQPVLPDAPPRRETWHSIWDDEPPT